MQRRCSRRRRGGGRRGLVLLVLTGCVDQTGGLPDTSVLDAGVTDATVVFAPDAGEPAQDAGIVHRLAALTRCPGAGLDETGRLARFGSGRPDLEYLVTDEAYLDADLYPFTLVTIRADGTASCESHFVCEGLSPAIAVSSCEWFRWTNCVVRDDQSIACQDYNGVLQTFEGPFQDVAVTSAVVGQRTDGRLRALIAGRPSEDLPTDTPFRQFALGWYGGCGLLEDGHMRCWGDLEESHPLVAPEGTFRVVRACFNHFCAIRSSGALLCWRADAFPRWTPPEGRFIDVSAPHTIDRYPRVCALTEDHALTCFEYGH